VERILSEGEKICPVQKKDETEKRAEQHPFEREGVSLDDPKRGGGLPGVEENYW